MSTASRQWNCSRTQFVNWHCNPAKRRTQQRELRDPVNSNSNSKTRSPELDRAHSPRPHARSAWSGCDNVAKLTTNRRKTYKPPRRATSSTTSRIDRFAEASANSFARQAVLEGTACLAKLLLADVSAVAAAPTDLCPRSVPQ